MKVLFIEARRKNLKLGSLKDLPEKIHVLYSIQYKDLAQEVRKKLGKRVVAFEQLLGCSEIKSKASLLLVGSGRFHALQLALSTGKDIYLYNNKLIKISKEEIETERKIEKGKIIRFLSSNNIGVLFSRKPGQDRLKEQEKIIKTLVNKYPDKKFYLFISDNININDLDNFPIDLWLSTACLGLDLDSKKIINYKKIISLAS